MPLTTGGIHELSHRLTGGSSGTPQHYWEFIQNRIAGTSAAQTVVNRIRSLWRMDKSPGAVGSAVASTTPAVCHSSFSGAMQISSASASSYTVLLGVEAMGAGTSMTGVLMLYDRLLHCGPFPNNTTAANAATTGVVVDRFNSTVSTHVFFAGGNQIWIENATALGTTAVNCSVKYVNELGTSGRQTPNTPLAGAAASGIHQVIPLPLQAGDRGVLSIEGFQVGIGGTSQAVAAAHNIVIARPLLSLPVSGAGYAGWRDTLSGLPAMPHVPNNRCLAWTFLAYAVCDPTLFVGTHFVDTG